jgi:diaminopimelate decarboxylase/aspartate kinase
LATHLDRFLHVEWIDLGGGLGVVERPGQRDLGFVGLATGMNSLMRPALYGAWHGIHNLTRLAVTPNGYWNVVGPICETSDVLGSDRLLPESYPGDVILIENAGAYGAVMASSYNCRAPAEEVIFDG